MFRQCSAIAYRIQRRHKTFQDHCRFAGTGDAGHDSQLILRDTDRQRMNGVDLFCFEQDLSCREEIFSALAFLRSTLQILSDQGDRIFFDLFYRSFGDDSAAVGTGLGTELDQPVGFFQDLGIMIDQQDRVSVFHKIVHDCIQTEDICRMQSDRGLIQNIQDAGSAVAHRSGKLHTLAFACRKRGGCAVQSQIAEAEIHQPFGNFKIRFTDVFGHLPHFFRERLRYLFHPLDRFPQTHLTGLIQRDAHQFRGSGCFREPGPVAFGAGFLFQELLDPFHSFLILDFAQGIQDSRGRAVIGKIHLRGDRIRFILRTVENMFLDHRTVIDDLFFLVGQVFERNVGAHAHRPADVGHQCPHQRVPWGNGAFVDGQFFVGDQGAAVNGADRAGSAAAFAGALGVKGKFLRSGTVKVFAAFRADDLLHGGDRETRLYIMTVGTAVTGKARIHQPQAVEQFRAGPERRADPGNGRTLMQRQRCRHVKNIIHIRAGRLGHASSGIGRQGFKIPSGPLGIKHAKGKRGFS